MGVIVLTFGAGLLTGWLCGSHPTVTISEEDIDRLVENLDHILGAN